MKPGFLLWTALCCSANAAALVNYDFQTTGTTADGAVSASNTISPTTNYTSSIFSAGLGLQGNVPGSNPAFVIAGFSNSAAPAGAPANTRHMFVRVGGTDSNTQEGAVAANDYYSFTITPAAGYSLSLTSLAFDLAHGVASTVFVRSSLDGFTNNLFIDTTTAGTGNGLLPVTPVTFDSSYQNITAPLEFRFYFADDVSNSTTNSVVTARLDNIALSGDVLPIPEPSALMLLGLAALPMVVRRRRD